MLPPSAARVLFDGTFSEPKLSHPEGVAMGPDGWVLECPLFHRTGRLGLSAARNSRGERMAGAE